LAHASEITAATVLGEMRIDQRPQLDRLVSDIANEYALDAALRTEDGRFSVRFSLPADLPKPAQSSGGRSWLGCAFAWWIRTALVSRAYMERGLRLSG
jgi:hypothetical protein